MDQKAVNAEQLMVGIFWLIGHRLIIDASSLNEAEAYGDCLGHRRSHVDYWEVLRKNGIVDPRSEYDEFPRGRVTFNTKKNETYLLADRCIRRDSSKVTEIIRSLHLPKNTIVDSDPHYRCPKCLRGSNW